MELRPIDMMVYRDVFVTSTLMEDEDAFLEFIFNLPPPTATTGVTTWSVVHWERIQQSQTHDGWTVRVSGIANR